MRLWLSAAIIGATGAFAVAQMVGSRSRVGVVTPTIQSIRPLGSVVKTNHRPIDFAVSHDGKTAYVLDEHGVTEIDLSSGKVRAELASPTGTSMHGILLSSDGKSLFVSGAASRVERASVDPNGLNWKGGVDFPSPRIGGPAYPVGMRIVGSKLYVCLSRSNSLAEIDLSTLRIVRSIPVDPAPFDVCLTPNGKSAYVTCWSRQRKQGESEAPSAGTRVPIDTRGIGVGGSLCKIDLRSGAVVARTPVGSQPTQVVLARDGRGYVANANSDTVTVIDARTGQRTGTLRIGSGKLLGYAPNALALSPDEKVLYVACGGVNAIARIDLAGPVERVVGFAPAGRYPAGLAVAGDRLLIANVKGEGSRWPHPERTGHSVYDYLGTVSVPTMAEVNACAAAHPRTGIELAVAAKPRRGIAAKPIPDRVGEPSPIKHVVYVLKENRTYDQLLGDLGRGNGDPNLAIYGRDVTPNHHALAEQFANLDNYYCCGVNSADGHAWGMEGQATSYFEKTFGGWTRSYPFGDDPLSVSSSGFLWDPVIDRGISFRNYGEFDYASTPGKTRAQLYADYLAGKSPTKFAQNIGVARLRSFSCRGYPGWNLEIPDVVRAEIFAIELRQMEKRGVMPRLTIVYLPCDHTSGTAPGQATPRAMVADNDLALGKIVEAISHSRFWKSTCIFVNEDDAQDGFDHIDGHRSLCLVVSPYTKRGSVVSTMYNQDSVMHTVHQILGVPPINMMEATAPPMSGCFSAQRNLAPYQCVPAKIRLDETNPLASALVGEARRFAVRSASLDFSGPDRADEDVLNRILWFSARGGMAYPDPSPAEFGKVALEGSDGNEARRAAFPGARSSSDSRGALR